MPIYEYHCAACDIEFEELVPISAKDEVHCGQCGAKAQRIASCCFGFSENASTPLGASAGC